MNWFGNINSSAKQTEIERLINDTMRATFDWEQAGEKSFGSEITEAATAIRMNMPKIVQLYEDLARSNGSHNFNVKNWVLPAPMPSKINIQMAITGIFQFSEILGNKNASFRDGLISPDTLTKFSRIISGRF